MDEVAAARERYLAAGLDESDIAADPLAQFEAWLSDAVAAGLWAPDAVVVATADAGGAPSSRLVLLRGCDEQGFVFYTNYDSRKAAELTANPRAALLFPWHALERQVRVEGRVERATEEASAQYFAGRPRGAQLGAWASPQSRVIPSRRHLDEQVAEVTARLHGREVPLPPHWGGFRVVPDVIEFWQGRQDRLHDRLRYGRDGSGWTVHRLAP